MPELPDVELFKRHLEATSLGRTIKRVVVNDRCILGKLTPSKLAMRLEGSRIRSALRHGKHLLMDIGPASWLTMHFGMNGSLRYFRDPEPDPSYDRVRLDFAGGHHLAYVNPRMIGHVGLTESPQAFITAEHLGLDALSLDLDLRAFRGALAERKRDIKSVLMDQSIVAGVGNIYSDEILFQARLHPRAIAAKLDASTVKRLYTAMKNVLRTAVDRGAGAERLVDRLPARFLIPQRIKNGRCPRCKSATEMGKFAGRIAYYCPRCQQQ